MHRDHFPLVHYYCYFIIIFFVLSTSSLTTAQQRQSNISRGSSLTPTKTSSWLSKSGLYTFGFYQRGNGYYSVGVFLAGIQEKTVVWTANRDDPLVSGNATLLFTATDGRPVLQTPQDKETNIADISQIVSYASMLDTGNFVLCDTCVFISIMYEKLPEFCASCSSVGHNVANCRWNKGPTKTDTAGIVDPIIKPDPKENPKVRQEYRVKDCLTRIINDVQGHHVDQDAEEAVEITFAVDQTIPNIEEAVNDQLVTANPMQVVVEANDAIPVVSMHTFGTLVEVNNPLASRGAMEINFDASVVVLDNEIFDQLSTEEDIVDKLAENDDFSLTIREIAASEAVNMVSDQAGIEAEWTAVKNRKKRQGKKSPYSEPWVSFADIPRAFWRTLKLQLVCTNHRIGKQPNLWVLASAVNVQIVSITSQQVTLTVNLDQNLHKISFVYANSTSYIMRRDLLNDLWVVHSSNSTSWLVLGNFNVVLGAHEKTGDIHWILGWNSELKFWYDNWLGQPLYHLAGSCTPTNQLISDFYIDGSWNIPLLLPPDFRDSISKTIIVNSSKDSFVWMLSKTGDLTSKEAYSSIRNIGSKREKREERKLVVLNSKRGNLRLVKKSTKRRRNRPTFGGGERNCVKKAGGERTCVKILMQTAENEGATASLSGGEQVAGQMENMDYEQFLKVKRNKWNEKVLINVGSRLKKITTIENIICKEGKHKEFMSSCFKQFTNFPQNSLFSARLVHGVLLREITIDGATENELFISLFISNFCNPVEI
ncbi:hypothetical protein LWI29_029853 [Acer saccharum]|uniref:Bulb-type lectin domain-containing protein n=1 Tax=Acer saccharum TaxID=4024 RepID=A0AA39TIG8_ACESA|nr:hypothetical protein LWI29_029853 [Acer saccharum]